MRIFIIIAALCFLVLVINEESRHKIYHGLFGLRNNDTVMDYRNTSFEKQLYWATNACKDGACLSRADWKCGFANGDEALVQNCFFDLIQASEANTPLDTIRKTCGRLHMEFVGELYSKKEECPGNWGGINEK